MSLSSADIMKSGKKSRPDQRGEPALVRLQPELADLIDAWRRLQEDMPGRPEAIRRLTALALEAEAAKKGKRGK